MRVSHITPPNVTQIKGGSNQSNQPSFSESLTNALQEVNQLQNKSDVAFEQLITGDIEFHDAMIIADQANLALQLTMAIRSKMIEAYQEITRIQI